MEKKAKRKEDMSWDDIGEVIGKKVGCHMEKFGDKMDEKFGKDECCGWKPPWAGHKHDGGGCGRFVFIIALLYILSLKGLLVGIPWWALALLVIGFSGMRL